MHIGTLARTVSATILAGAILVVGPPVHAATPLPLVFAMSSTLASPDPAGRQLFVNTTSSPDEVATLKEFSLAVTETEPDSARVTFDLYPPAGSNLQLGHYTNVQRGGGSSSLATVDMEVDSEGITPANGDVTILDLAADPSGKLTRLDLVYRFDDDRIVGSLWGEVRLGEPQPGNHLLSTTTIAWPDAPVGAPLFDATEWVRNTGSDALSVGSPSITGAAAGDFAVTDNGCAAPVSAGALCPIRIGYTPRGAGDRAATLTLPVAGGADVVVLSGQSPPGRTEFSTAGPDYVDQGHTLDEVDGTAGQIVGTAFYRHRIQFRVATFDGSVNDHFVLIDSGSVGELTTGVHPVLGGGSRTTWLVAVGADGRGCGDLTGSVDVRQLVFNPDGTLALADIGLDLVCHNGMDDEPMTGAVYWRVAPTRPTEVEPGPATVAVRTVVPIQGSATPGAAVQVLFRQRGTTGYQVRRTLTADLSGRFATTFVPVDDYAYYLTAPGYTPVIYRTQIAPVIAGPAAVSVTRRHPEPLSGTATPGATIQLRFHRPGTATSTDVLRTVAVDGHGGWSRPYLVVTSYVITARLSTNGVLSSPTTVTATG